MKKMKKIGSKVLASVLASAMLVGGLSHIPVTEVQAAFGGKLTAAVSASADENIVMVTFNDGVQAKITFLEDGIFRYNVDPNGEFSEYGRENNGEATAKIVQYPDDYEAYSLPKAAVDEEGDYIVITSGQTVIRFEKATAKMTVEFGGNVVMEESDSLSLGGTTTQSLVKHDGENFYGGGTQNGRFVHTGETINIANESNWVDGGVASPCPFYYTTEGYGVLRNTFMPGKYHFGSKTEGVVNTVHNENEFDAYYFLSDGENSAEVVQDLLQGYFHVTGDPTLLPEYAFYMGHLNAYNRDSWTDASQTGESGGWLIKGSSSASGQDDVPIASNYKEHGQAAGYVLQDGMMAESLNGEDEVITQPGSKYPNITTPHEFSARGVIDQYIEYDMPLGYFLPNDGYGTGYGKNGYYMTGGVNADGSSTKERIAAIDANVENLREFTKYAQSKGVETGLWTQSNLSPDSYGGTAWHLLRDFEKEVKIGGITTLKTDVAWVGYGYNFAYNGIKNAYDIVTTGVNYRPNIISLDGWAGTQRFAGIWTGDQYGGNWEYIRFHVPTFIGQSLAGNPNVGSDMDGIFGGQKVIATRDTQWKSFGTVMLDMDGWGSYAKTPQTFGDPYTGIARMYLKTKAQLMPYIYTNAAAASNQETGNDDTGMPIVRAMFLEFPDDPYANTKAMQYQYMLGENLLVAPIYTETAAIDAMGNDVRNDIYLPDGKTAAEPAPLSAGEAVTEVFDDIDEDWYTGYVQYVYDNSLMTGIKGTEHFAPHANITKAQVAQVLYNMDGQPAVDLGSAKAFKELVDVYDAEWYAPAVAWAYETGVVTGDLNAKKFSPDADVTREQLALMIYRYAKHKGYDVSATSDFAGLVNADKVADWSMDGMRWAVGAGLISGAEVNGVKDLDPQGNASRAQVAAILQRFCEANAEEDTVSEDLIWIDYFTGEQYYGGQVLNNFDAPIWKLPVFVKNGAIIPMWEENNSPALVDRSNRLVEFWPAGNTEYTLYEDDGTYVQNEQTQIDGYGTVNDISYGDHVSTKYTSNVNGTTAVLTAEKSTGSYEGYDKDKNTTFIVNVSKEPSAVTAMNGSTALTKVAAGSKEEVLNAEVAEGTFVYYYDEAPAIETYGVEIEDEFAEMMKDEVSSPKLYVKFAETDSQANAQVLTIKGFENVDEDLPINKEDEALAVPENLRDVEESKTPTSNTIAWDAVEGAESYEIRINGVVNNVGNVTSYTHTDQAYNSTHTYAVRARGANGYSAWSDEIEASTALDPWRNVPKASIIWNGGEQWGALANATDHDTTSMFHSTGDVVTNAEPFIFDFGSVYKLDHFEYYPRDAYSNGTVNKMDIYVSLDGVHWSQAFNGAENRWTYSNDLPYEENVKTVDLSGQMARYVKLIVRESYGNFFSANELAIYKVDGSVPFAVGSTTQQPVVSDGDYTNMINYMGTSPKDESDFIDQIKQRGGDINKNDVYDVYDYTFTMFNLDGGTTKTGKISGTAGYSVSAETVKSGETFTIDVVAANVANLNAFGQVLDYDPALVDFVSVEAGSMLGEMEDMNRNKVYGDGSAYLNLAFANRGDKALVNGSGVLATITMKAKADITVAEVIDLTKLTIIGPDHSFIEIQTGGELPTPEPTPVVTKYGQNDVTITMTNSELTTDDGSNVTKLIQQGNYNGLFDGSFSDRGFEFLWDWEGNWDEEGKLPAYVKLPVTMNFEFKEDSKLTDVTVYNANKANGYITKAEAVVNYADGTTSDKVTLTIDNLTDYAAFEFAFADNGKLAESVDVTILEAITAQGEAVDNMLTLSEVELKYTEPVESGEPEDIQYVQSDVTVTMTNSELTTDDGSNVTKLIQQGNYDGLFNGGQGRDFEFVWDIETNWVDGKLPAYVTLPVTMNVAFKEASPLTSLTVYNANKANGYITKAEAVVNYADGTTSEKQTIVLEGDAQTDYAAFEFAWEDNGKLVESVDVTFSDAVTSKGEAVANMLTLAEMVLKYKSAQ